MLREMFPMFSAVAFLLAGFLVPFAGGSFIYSGASI
jgi:hypothetical protein